MNRRISTRRLLAFVRCWPLGLLAMLALTAGCVDPQIRSQCADDSDHEVKYDIQTIGEVTTVSNAEPIQVGGVGLVTGLEGTGSSPAPDGYRTMLEENLKKGGVQKVRELLNSPNVSLVLVSALVPAGARKSDPIDVEVSLPAGSKTTSLRSGVLRECVLYNYEYARNLSTRYANSERALVGDKMVKAGGPLLVGFGDGDEAAKQRQGRIWGGGHCLIERPLYLALNADHQYARVAAAVAARINGTFPGSFSGSPNDQLAKASNKHAIELHVPAQYRHNLPHYLRVVRLIPLREGAEPNADVKKDGASKVPYRRRLEEDLLNPARCVTAALRLEALGTNSIPALKTGLTSKHPLVRFCSAEALAYLDSPACGEELARLVEQHPVLRAFSLTALASMDQAVSHVKLRELLATANPEMRYGAFRALRALDDRDPSVQGELLDNSFWLHRVAPNSPGMVHISTTRRAEIVLFGEDAVLVPPFEFLAGDAVKFTVTAGQDDEHCTISCFAVHRGAQQTRQCSLKLEDMLRTLADLGGMYPEAVEVLRQAHTCRCLNCPVVVDALPQAVPVQELAQSGVKDPDLLRLDGEILEAKPDFGATPNLYQKSAYRPRSEDEADEGAALRDRKPQRGKDVE